MFHTFDRNDDKHKRLLRRVLRTAAGSVLGFSLGFGALGGLGAFPAFPAGIPVIGDHFLPALEAFAADGWQLNADEKWEYYEGGELKKSSWIDANGHWYRTDANGIRVRNTSAGIDGSRYLFDSEGRMLSGGWVSIQADRTDPNQKASITWYYAEADGKLYTDGWYQVDGGWYYFSSNGSCVRQGVTTVTTKAEDGTETKKKYYIDPEKGCLGGGDKPGWFSVDTENSNKTVTTTWYYAREDSSLYYEDWFQIDGHKIYFDASGRAQLNKWFKIGDENICVNADGDRIGPGWVSLDNIDSKGNPYTTWYYMNPDMTRLENGFHEIDGKRYFFGTSANNYRKNWYQDPEGRRYYLDEDGVLQAGGWFSITTVSTNSAGEEVTSVAWYYADQNGSVCLNGEHEIDGKTYFFSTYGANLRKAFRTVGKRRKYYGDDGAMKKNEWFSVTSTSTVTGPATMEMEQQNITTEKETWYFADEEGYVLSSSTKKNTQVTIDGQEYSVSHYGVMATDWQRDRLGDYTLYGTDGAKVYGWTEYEIPDSWLTDKDYYDYVQEFGHKAWFYLDPENEGKAVRYRAYAYGEVEIQGHVYAANKRGMIWLGWCKTQNTREDGMLRYRYYMPKAENGFMQAERAASTAVYTAPPLNMSMGTEPTWYYFDGAGDFLHAPDGETDLILIGERDHVIVDMYGRTKSGLGYSGNDRMPVQKVYYCDPTDQNKTATGIREVTLPDGRKEMYAFHASGEGVSGERDGYLYYKGRRQTGSGIRAVAVWTNEIRDEKEQFDVYLVDAEGKILKNAENVEGEGGTFSSSASGNVTTFSGKEERAEGPAMSDFSFYVGEVGGA